MSTVESALIDFELTVLLSHKPDKTLRNHAKRLMSSSNSDLMTVCAMLINSKNAVELINKTVENIDG